MSVRRRAVVFVLGITAIWAGDVYMNEVAWPRTSRELAIASLNGGDAPALELRTREHFKDAANVAAMLGTAGLLAWLMAPAWRRRPVAEIVYR